MKFVIFLLAALAVASPRPPVSDVVAQIRIADYEGKRQKLRTLYTDLDPYLAKKDIESRVRYWRGFALWRRALNGFNDSADPKDLESDLNTAVAEFEAALVVDPEFVDAKVGAASCLMNLLYLHLNEQDRVREYVLRFRPLVEQAKAQQPDNPRLLWILGASLWSTPPQAGGDRAKALRTFSEGLQSSRKKRQLAGPLDPAWGEAELLMNLAWSNLNGATPDVQAAEQYAREALALVPYWHYVRDILLPQIERAKR